MDEVKDKIEKLNSMQEAIEIIHKIGGENKHLKDLNAMRTDLISLNAHQLRTSLSAIKWIMKMFIDGDFGEFTPEQREVFEKSYETNERAIKLVTEMLRSNKTEKPDIDYKFEKIKLEKFIESIIFEFSAEAKKAMVELSYKNKGEILPPIYADPEKIRIVFQNLIENAIKYNRVGGSVVVSVKLESNQMMVSVADTGIGVAKECEDGVFEKFYRAPNAVEGPYTGTGLGLYNSKKIVERHGGEMGFDSKKNEGSIFHFTVPIAKKS